MRFILTCLILSVLFGSQTVGQVICDGKQTWYVSSSCTDWASLLLDESVREDLELLDNQKVELDKLIKKTGVANQKAQELFWKIGDSLKTPEERKQDWEDHQALMDSIRVEFEVESKNHLLPHQVIRLKRVMVVRQLEQSGVGNLFSDLSPIGSVLQLSPEERKKLKAKADQVGAKLEKKIAALQQEIADLKLEAAGEILSELPADKQNLIRDQFDLEF